MRSTRVSFEKLRKDIRRRVAANLRALRYERALSQERAAELAGYSLQYFQRIEGTRVNVPLDTISRLAHAFGVDPARLLAPAPR